MLSENEYITYDEKQINALRTRLNQQIKFLNESQVASKNELRSIAGLESIGEEADTIYIPSNLVPIGTNPFDGLENNPFDESEESDQDIPDEPTKDFVRLMRKNSNDISNEEIKKLWDDYKANTQ